MNKTGTRMVEQLIFTHITLLKPRVAIFESLKTTAWSSRKRDLYNWAAGMKANSGILTNNRMIVYGPLDWHNETKDQM